MCEPKTLHVIGIKPDATSLEAPYFQGKKHPSSRFSALLRLPEVEWLAQGHLPSTLYRV